MKVQKLRDVPTPCYAKPGDAGLDLTNASGESVTIPAGQKVRIPTGVAVAIPEGHVGLLLPRSSLDKNAPLALSNTVGVIDSQYRGEILASVINRGGVNAKIDAGERIVQLVVIPYKAVEIEVVDVLDVTDRGAGGFGSTGTTEITKKEAA